MGTSWYGTQALESYQLVFRHLFELKWVERELNRVWGVLQATRGLDRWAGSIACMSLTCKVTSLDVTPPA